jgi:hypothetical protein
MGFTAAAIAAVGTLASTGIQAGMAASQGGGDTPSVKLHGVNLQDPNAAFYYYNEQAQQFPGVAAFTGQVNQTDMQQYIQMLNQLYPGVTQQLGQVSNIAQSYLSGQLPSSISASVQGDIARATAQQATQGGYAGTGMARSLTLRDLGQSAQSGLATGLNFYNAGLGIAQSLIPGYINPGQLLFSPAQLQARQDQQAYYNNEVQNQQQIVNAGLAQQSNMMSLAQQAQQQAQVGNMFNSIFGTATNPSKFSSGLATSGLFGGGNVNPNFNLNWADLTAQSQGYTSYAAGEAAGAI